MTTSGPGALAEKLVEMVGRRAAAAVTVTHTRQGLTRFANSFIHQNVMDEHTQVYLQLSLDGRPATATTYRSDDQALEGLVDKAMAAAALRPVDPAWAGLAPPAALVGAGDLHYDTATAEVGPAERAEAVAAFVSAGDGLVGAGFCETTQTDRYFANSAGQHLDSHDTSAALDAILRAPAPMEAQAPTASPLRTLSVSPILTAPHWVAMPPIVPGRVPAPWSSRRAATRWC